MPDDFQEITTYSNWNFIDQLGANPLVNGTAGPFDPSKTLKNGDHLEIRFPDGSVRFHAIVVKDESYDAGPGSGHIPVTKAYINIEYCGMTAQIPIKGLNARRLP